MHRIECLSVVVFLGLLAGCAGGGGSSAGGGDSASSSSSTGGGGSSSSGSSSGGGDISSSGSSSSSGASGSSGSGGSSSSSSSGAGACSEKEFPLQGYATQNGGTTGGAGGPVVYAGSGTEIHQALCNRPSNDTPVIIHVEGTVNHGNTSKVSGSCNTADDKIEIKDISNVSIIGVGDGALFDELGIHIRNASNIILQNLHVRNVKKSGSPVSNGGDAIGMEADVANVWVDHCTLEASGGESEGFDSLFDLKNNTRYVTLSYSILRHSGRGGLVGSGDGDDQNNYITFHHNLYQNIDSRTPLLRFATAHSYNNYFNGINKSGMNPRIGGQIKAENNYFENAKDPLGTFYTNDMGYWDVSGNIFAGTVTWTEVGNENYPAGPDPVSTTSIDIPYAYSLDDATEVKSHVMNCAGAGVIDGVSSGGGSSSGSTSSGGGSSSSSSSSSTSGGPLEGGWTAGTMEFGPDPYTNTTGSVAASSETAVTFTVNRGKFESAKEAFYFIGRDIEGDFEFTANLSAMDGPTRADSNQGHVGIMLCIDCVSGAATAAATAKIGVHDNSGDSAIIHTHRLSDGGSRVNNETSVSVTPGGLLYLRITRTGNSYTVSYSTDGGGDYTVADTRTFTEAVPATVKVGLYAAQGEDAGNGFTFDNISLTQ